MITKKQARKLLIEIFYATVVTAIIYAFINVATVEGIRDMSFTELKALSLPDYYIMDVFLVWLAGYALWGKDSE